MTVYKLSKNRAENMALVNERLVAYNKMHDDEVVFAFVAGQYRLCREGGEFPAPLAVESLKHILEDGGAQWSHPYRTGTDPTRGHGIPREWLVEFLGGTPEDFPDIPVISDLAPVTVPDEIPFAVFKVVCIDRAHFAGIGNFEKVPEAVPTQVGTGNNTAAQDALKLGAVVLGIVFVIGLILILILFDVIRWRIGDVIRK